MKQKIKKQLKKLRKTKPVEQPSDGRITNETVAEHREQILAGGRRFKYPVQYSRYKLVINSIVIAVAGVVIVTLFFWWQLYVVQNDSKFMYRFTQLVPVPVAQIDGQTVPYSDYLKRFRSSIHYLEEQNNLNRDTVDGKKEIEYRKRQELDNALRDAYTRKLAKENDISVPDSDVSRFITNELDFKKVSEAAYERTVLNNFYDWTMDDYRSVVRAELLKRKVSFAIDTAARQKADRVLAALRAEGADFAAIARAESDDEATKGSGGDSGSIPRRNLDPNGIITAVAKLEPGQTTDLVYGSDGYYIAKLTKKDSQNVQFQFIKIALTEFDKRFKAAREADTLREYIKIEEPES